jgi:hypothetical protein
MPFIRIPQAINNALAFQPHTLQTVHPRGGSLSWALGAYWHEMKAGKHIACYGVVYFEDAAGASGEIDPGVYDDILAKTDNQAGVYAMSHLAGLKVGHAKPYSYEPLFEEIERSNVDEGALDQMLQSLTYLPPNTDGWFKRPPAYSSEKFWRTQAVSGARTL